MTSRKFTGLKMMFAAMTLALAGQAQSASSIGNVGWVEVWPSGNLAFRIAGTTAPCTTQTFIINKTNEGAKNLIATVLMARASGIPLTVTNSVCGPADGYGGSYAIIDYLYIY